MMNVMIVYASVDGLYLHNCVGASCPKFCCETWFYDLKCDVQKDNQFRDSTASNMIALSNIITFLYFSYPDESPKL